MKEKDHGGRNGNGYTIIEVLIALSLLVAAMIPLAVVLSTTLRSTVTSKVNMQARELASSEIDQVKGMDFGAIGISGAPASFADAAAGETVAPEEGYPGLDAGPETVETAAGYTFEVTRSVTKNVNTTRGNAAATKKVVITVSWTQPEPAGSETMSTVIGPTGKAE